MIGSPASDTMIKSRGLSSNRSVSDWPGPRCTLRKPRRARMGSPATFGMPRYSCATSSPARLPVLVTVTSAVKGCPADTGLLGTFAFLLKAAHRRDCFIDNLFHVAKLYIVRLEQIHVIGVQTL